MTCNHDCFHCPYEDCICDEETPAEIAAAERRDKEAKGGPKRKRTEQTRQRDMQYYRDHREEQIAYGRAYYQSHKEEIKAYHAEWYQRNKARVLAHQKEYQRANREKITAKKREKRQREKAQKEGGTHEREAGTQTEALGSV